MDQKINTYPKKRRRILLGSLLLLVAAVAIYGFTALDFGSTITVKKETIKVAEVQRGMFRSYINLTGFVEPAQTFFLDANERGIVRAVPARSGDRVKKGDTLLLLNNSDLQLEVMQREAQLLEQFNNQRQTRLLLKQNNLEQQERIAEISYQLDRLKPQFQRAQQLFRDSVIPEAEYEPVASEYRYNLKRREILRKAYRTDSAARQMQLTQIDRSQQRIARNLEAVQGIMDRLCIKAPLSGKLANFTIQKGEAVETGQRLGQIYNLSSKIIRAQVDELYLNKINRGIKGSVKIDGRKRTIEVVKVYPSIEEGQFRIDCRFQDSSLQDGQLRKGQSLRLELYLGKEQPSVLLPNGNFYNQTGGNWIYRLRNEQAERTPIKLGRRNPDYFEVTDGLEPGDRVIISSYAPFGEYEKLNLE